MKTGRIYLAIIAIITGILTGFSQQQTPPAQVTNPPAAAAPAEAPPATAVKPPDEKPAVAPAPVVAPANGAQPARTTNGNGIRLNFRGAPLETVLKYLSEAAGFIIIPKADVTGKVDVWSNQPLTKDEAYELLNTILKDKALTAIRNDRTLTIVTLDDARKLDIPVKSGSNPADIPKTEQMVTQIIPIRYANATLMTRDLQPLMRDSAVMTANESGNALVITDTQSSIKRLAEIVKALDTSISSISAIRVFPLRYADAKELANAVKELFDTSASQRNQGRGALAGPLAQFFNRGPGGPGGFGGGPGGFGGGPGGDRGGRGGGFGQAGAGASEARQAASRVVAVADERTNSLIVSAPDEYFSSIEKLVEDIDKVVDDLTVLRVFHLKNADPTYLASQIATLFPDETRSNQGNQGFRGGFQFLGGGQGGFGGGRGGGSTTAQQSERMKKMGRVLAVPDARTSSIMVSASAELMPQIGQMIEELDIDPARKQKVYVFPLENADVNDLTTLLSDMFQGNNGQISSIRRNQNQQNNALNNRQLNTSRLQGANTGIGGGRTSGFGGTGGGFGGQ